LYRLDFNNDIIDDEYLLSFCPTIIPSINNKEIVKRIINMNAIDIKNEYYIFDMNNEYYINLQRYTDSQKIFKLNLNLNNVENLKKLDISSASASTSTSSSSETSIIIPISKEFKSDFLNRSDNRKIITKYEYHKIILKYIYDNLLQDKVNKWIYYPDLKLRKYLKMRDDKDNKDNYIYKTFKTDLIII
jgi:hypothetical protein